MRLKLFRDLSVVLISGAVDVRAMPPRVHSVRIFTERVSLNPVSGCVVRSSLIASGLSVAVDHASALCALRRADEAAAGMERMVQTYPFHEPFWELLMRALYHSGRSADALWGAGALPARRSSDALERATRWAGGLTAPPMTVKATSRYGALK